MELVTTRNIRQGEEVTICYLNKVDKVCGSNEMAWRGLDCEMHLQENWLRPKEKREIIFASYGFACCCVACTGLKAFGKISLVKLYILNNYIIHRRWLGRKERKPSTIFRKPKNGGVGWGGTTSNGKVKDFILFWWADADFEVDADADAFKVGGKPVGRSWGEAELAKRGLGQGGAVINVWIYDLSFILSKYIFVTWRYDQKIVWNILSYLWLCNLGQAIVVMTRCTLHNVHIVQ